MKSVFVVSLGIVMFFQLTGCIILPLPPLGAQIGQEDVETIEAGVSTRDQVHAVLGKPEATILDRYEIFDVSKERFNWLIMTYFGGHIKRVRGQSYRVLAEYDPEDVLRDLRWEGHGEEPSEEPRPKASWADTLDLGTWDDELRGAVSASPDGRLLAQSASYIAPLQSPAIKLRDGGTGNVIAEVDAVSGCPPIGFNQRHESFLSVRVGGSTPVTTVFLSDSEHLASITSGETLCVWNANTQMSVRQLAGGDSIRRLVSARSAPNVAVSDDEGTIRIWDALSGKAINTIATRIPDSRYAAWLKMVLSDDGKRLAVLQSRWADVERFGLLWDRTFVSYEVRLWDVDTGIELAALNLVKPETEPPYLVDSNHNIALSSDQTRVAVNLSERVEIWRLAEPLKLASQERAASQADPWTLEQVLVLPPLGDVPSHLSIAFSADGRKLAAGYLSAIVWEVGTWRTLWRAPLTYAIRLSFHRGFGFIFTADGQRIISSCCLWEVPE